MSEITARTVPAPSIEKQNRAVAIAKAIADDKAKYEPYIGKRFIAKDPKLPETDVWTVVDLIVRLPMGSRGVNPVFRVSRSPRPSAKFAVCDEFLNSHDEIPADPPKDSNAPAATT